LNTVILKASDEALVALARIRLAGIELDQGNADAATKLLNEAVPVEFEAIKADRWGDLYALKGQSDDARQAYQKAWNLMAGELEYRRLIEAKLNALGVNPNATSVAQEPTR
jgi:predicted negative regulator of RcsB-dependent stress response